jgi:hypothetical protein
MKKLSIALLAAFSLNATNLTELFNAIKKTPDTQIDNILIKKTQITQKEVKDSLLPTLSIFASIEHFSTPTNLRPLPPTESAKIRLNNGGYPFSRNIQKIGFVASMPLFVKNIYDTKKKISHLLKASKYKAKINLLKRESLLITILSKYNYLIKLKKALQKERDSITLTLNAIKVGVKAGRIPEFKALRLKDGINQLNLKIESVNIQIDSVISQIYQLTKIKLHSPVDFYINSQIEQKEFLAIKPLKEKLKASDYDIKLAKDSFYPKIMLQLKGPLGKCGIAFLN